MEINENELNEIISYWIKHVNWHYEKYLVASKREAKITIRWA